MTDGAHKDAAAQGAVLNTAALEPLFETWQEPASHRARPEKRGDPARIVKGRRRSPIGMVNNIRAAVSQWRESGYAGASDTTMRLLRHWFGDSHRAAAPSGETFEFRYYFCQREAMETLAYLKEVRGIETLSQIIAEFGGQSAEIDSLGITDDEDAWSRYAFKLATGAGKTKVMSLAIVWSYFHALRESDSPMARHFVLIAPGLTVYERLKEDFKPEGGGPDIFDRDPLIPPEWRGDWNLTTVLQDAAGGAATGGTLYLTNIDRLHDRSKRKAAKDNATYDWAGPSVSKSKALDTGAALRERVTAHQRVMVLNDEAHHVWDPDSAWNEAIRYLHDTILSRTGGGIVAQLDFSATPKDKGGHAFKHIVCDTPLGEAVDAGIVKTPLIGRGNQKLSESADDNAAYRYDMHLQLGYERWRRSQAEWEKSGKKPLLFVMCENTEAADQIAARLNTDESFKELNARTINLHTNLKGKIKKIGKGDNARMEFQENEKEISDEDLKALRKLSRELDNNTSPYRCIVSVMMLREGWDVRNVTTIVPLRPYSSKAGILPEQTLGRGLRRMTPPGPGQPHELVTVVEHPKFVSLYEQELEQEGLFINEVDVDNITSTTITIFPDETKDLKALEIMVPALTAGYRIEPKVEGLTIADVKKAFAPYTPLPLGTRGSDQIEYEGRSLITGEVVERMTIHVPLLATGIGAVSFYVKEIETICKVRGLHATIAPLVQTFIEDMLFEHKSTLADERLVQRLGDPDVREHIRAVFVPLVRSRTTKQEKRERTPEPMRLSRWKPYPVTHNEHHPARRAARTLFNLVPCKLDLEVVFTTFADRASDVAAFAKNAGPQCLRIDYLDAGGRLAFYTPDFFVRAVSGTCYLVETKGRVDRDVPRKARAAVAWCESASQSGAKWDYLYVAQGVFEKLGGNNVEELARTCVPALHNLIHDEEIRDEMPLFAGSKASESATSGVEAFIEAAKLEALPQRCRTGIEHAVAQYRFCANKEGMNLAPVFAVLLGALDDVARGVLARHLGPEVPQNANEQRVWFEPYFDKIDPRQQGYYRQVAQNLRKALLVHGGQSPIGLLRSCLDYALNDKTRLLGVFEAVREQFRMTGGRKLLDVVTQINDFRNKYIAHQEQELLDKKLAERELRRWIEGIGMLQSA